MLGGWLQGHEILPHTFRRHSQGNCGARPRKDGEQREGGKMLSVVGRIGPNPKYGSLHKRIGDRK